MRKRKLERRPLQRVSFDGRPPSNYVLLSNSWTEIRLNLRLRVALQIDVVLATRDDLLRQRAELETRAKQQSQDQSDIYQYLRNKLKDNYVAIAELETKVCREGSEYRRSGIVAHNVVCLCLSVSSSLSDTMFLARVKERVEPRVSPGYLMAC